MVEDAVGSERRTGDVFRLYAEIYSLRLGDEVVALAPSCPVVRTTPEDGEPGNGEPRPRRWRPRR